LSPDLYRRFALPYVARIASEVKAALGEDAVPMTIFAKGAHWANAELESTDYDVVGLDWTMDPVAARKQLKGRMAVQGNLDPAVLYAPADIIRHEVGRMMTAFGPRGHIANLGHGMCPDMKPEALKAFVDAVHAYPAAPDAVIRLGTRASVLAMWQTHHVVDCLTRAHPGVRFEVRQIRSAGDLNLKLDLDKFERPGVFTDALEEALLAGEVDVLVHSLKDMPSTLRPGTALAAISAREDPRDAIVMHSRNRHIAHVGDLPAGSVVGTSSARRRAQLAAAYPHLTFKAVRGNVKTRLSKLDDYAQHGYEALCLAAAGLIRLGMGGRIHHTLDAEQVCLHAVGQGALGLQVRAPGQPTAGGRPDDQTIAELCRTALEDPLSSRACLAERAYLRGVGGGCSLPIGVHSKWQPGAEGKVLSLKGIIASTDGKRQVTAEVSGPAETNEQAVALGTQLCDSLLTEEGKALLKEVRDARDAAAATASSNDHA
jgi:hydroxymethylbilane synthase